ncbi:sodium-coupled monocarboxylate transporter 2-like isoform X2 [Phymastichus coffea]|uniref:sodium-coupled monocarboxylate transporter 2-like isoform X2 n=1 Tax=Phymastichus coffea TaxID=108790 RepID=UPI00273B7D04|nr:sodium-coupled monocarboxylate transporter 2-like isoform X2 [Phymastichus coffea]
MHVSGITLLGVPTEVYKFGSEYFLVVFTIMLTCVAAAYICLPVFYKLQLLSTYEYLEIRFSRQIRTLASTLYIISLLMYIPIVIYVPALALSQVTGYSLYIITPLLCCICIIYTSLGGVKAVIWTDTIQFAFTMGGLLVVCFIGVYTVGGFSDVWSIAKETNRTEIFNMSLSPYVRKSFWGMTISYTTLFLTHFGVSQNCMQRYLSIPSLKDAKKAIFLLAVGMIIMKVVCGFTGLAMYAHYKDCDPIRAKIVKRSDQIVPYYVMDIAGHLSGLTGVYLAGLASCALSTMSASLNTLAGTIYDDFIDNRLPSNTNKEARATTIMKVISVIIGLIGMAMTFLVQHLGTVFELSISIRSVVEGPLLGLFVLGMIFPWVGRIGALAGSIFSLITMHMLVIGNQWNIYNNRIIYTPRPTSIEGCSFPLNETLKILMSNSTTMTNQNQDEPFFLFRISMLHFNFIGTLVSVVTALVTSFIIKETDISKIDPDHVIPCIRRVLPSKTYVGVPLKELSGNKVNGNELCENSQNNKSSKKLFTSS